MDSFAGALGAGLVIAGIFYVMHKWGWKGIAVGIILSAFGLAILLAFLNS